jgi:predicted metal-dependent phosphoesterase TrpH
MIKIDMHVHSTFSDGTCTAEEIARAAARLHIAVVALTDHDTLEGIEPFRRACEKYSVRPISGVELSSKWVHTAHILGYRLCRPQVLKEAIEWLVKRRDERNIQIWRLLEKQGIDISMEEITKEAGGRVVGRPHIAAVLVKKGIVPDIATAFAKYLTRGGLAYVPRESYSPTECVKLIRDAGGLPVLAHPSLTGLDDDDLGDFLEKLKCYGLWGLECMSSHCSAEKSLNYLKIASLHSLFPTAGSDFHGSRRPGADLGVQVSEAFLPWARLGVTL